LTDIGQIRELEKIAFNAWPARERVNVGGGWIFRATSGITRRANSVFPIRELAGIDVEGGIKTAVEFYRRRSLIPRFQMTKASQPLGLDKELDEAGFTKELSVSIQEATLDNLASIEPKMNVGIHSQPSTAWLKAYASCGEFDRFSLEIRRSIMERVTRAKAFAAALVDGEVVGVGIGICGEVVGVGIGICEGAWLGLFALATLQEHRRKGIATAINQALAAWGMEYGAKRAYLQVFTENEPAFALYRQLGFKEIYKYWYRWLTPNACYVS
jgi:GNAT superfamily N-acetyltransferase